MTKTSAQKPPRPYWFFEWKYVNADEEEVYRCEFPAGSVNKAVAQARKVIFENASRSTSLIGTLFLSYEEFSDPIPMMKVSREYYGSKITVEPLPDECQAA